MKKPLATDSLAWGRGLNSWSKKERFRKQFLRSLRQSVRYGFSIEECFGVIWTETLEEFPLSEAQELGLYQELIDWAKHCIVRGAIADYSQDLSTENLRPMRENPTNYWVQGRI